MNYGKLDNITMQPPFNQSANEHTFVNCTDCHGANSVGDTLQADTSAQNIHSSSYQYMLKKSPGTNAMCLLCHKKSVYQDDGVGANGSRFNTSVYQAAYSTNNNNVYDAVYHDHEY